MITLSKLTLREIEALHPRQFWEMVRRGEWRDRTISPCQQYLKAGLCVLPKEYALDFLTLSHRNPMTFPVMDITDVGSPHPALSPDADLRTDLPLYDILVNGVVQEQVTEIRKYWQDDFVAFLIGCGVPLDMGLKDHKIDFVSPHALHSTTLRCKPAGRLSGPMAVAPRLFKTMEDVVRAIRVAAQVRYAHGVPLHIGDPSPLGFTNLYQGDILAATEPEEPSEYTIPAFWACGCSLQLVAQESRIPFLITQSPGYMFITDRLRQELD